MKNKTKFLSVIALLAIITLSLAITACPTGGSGGGSGSGGNGSTHTHSYSTTWSSNATQHWHECSCGDKADVANHTPNTETWLCTVCNGLTYNLGDTGPGGGKIFYLLQAGFTMTDNSQVCHYLEAAPADMSGTLAWASSAFLPPGNGGTGNWVDIPGTGTAIGTGRKNTALILATDTNAPAAKACKDYSNGGKIDWFLPSLDELNQLYVNRTSVGNMEESSSYWSSSQRSVWLAWDHRFSDGRQFDSSKNNPFTVRAVRAF